MGLIAIIDSEDDLGARVRDAVAASCAEATVELASEVASDAIEQDLYHVLVYTPGILPAVGCEAARTAADAGSHTAVIVIAPEVTTELLRTAMRAGVADVLSAQDAVADIARSVCDAYTAVDGRRAGSASAEAAHEAQRGRVVTVFSTKGGVGKTVLSTNLGTALAQFMGKRTAIIDLDLQFGDVGIMLGLVPERTITDVAASIERLDEDLLRGHMTHHESGVDVLLAPVRPEDAETLTTGRIARIIALMREMYDVVVVDTAATLDEVVLTALDNSDVVYALTMMDVASIKNMRISLQKLAQLGYDGDLVHVVLNRADSKVWLEPTEVERAVGAGIFARIPSDRVVPRSVNKGRPVVLDEPKTDVAKAMVGIAKSVAESTKGVATHVA